MEELESLLTTIFTIIKGAETPEGGAGYALVMMALFGGGLALIYWILEFTYKAFKAILNFLNNSWGEFMSVFKVRTPKTINPDKIELDFDTYTALKQIGSSLEKIAKKEKPNRKNLSMLE